MERREGEGKRELVFCPVLCQQTWTTATVCSAGRKPFCVGLFKPLSPGKASVLIPPPPPPPAAPLTVPPVLPVLCAAQVNEDSYQELLGVRLQTARSKHKHIPAANDTQQDLFIQSLFKPSQEFNNKSLTQTELTQIHRNAHFHIT